MLDFEMTYKDGKVYMEVKETKCIFKEDTHQYFLVDCKTGEVIKELISVTTLLRKHGLAPDYSGVPSETLKAKAEYGNLVHSEIEKYIKDGEIGFTSELQEFIEHCEKTALKPIRSEFIVHNDIVAGTVDLAGEYNEMLAYIDYKTTATLHKEAVRWQLSLYDYLGGSAAERLQAFHFASPLKVVDLEPIPLDEIEKLLECERNGEKYQPQQLVVEAELLARLADLQLSKKAIEDEEAEIKQQLLEAMRAQGIGKHETDLLRISYIEPSTREVLDGKKLKAEMPEIAAKYTKTSNVKDSVKVAFKGERNGED
ncbi:MAG: hypothetical protein IIX02_00060 [Clostridia bacterium]|nr:hypothetical protein [Clostridia bacterium]